MVWWKLLKLKDRLKKIELDCLDLVNKTTAKWKILLLLILIFSLGLFIGVRTAFCPCHVYNVDSSVERFDWYVDNVDNLDSVPGVGRLWEQYLHNGEITLKQALEYYQGTKNTPTISMVVKYVVNDICQS